MIERHCDSSTDTRNVHDVSHARGFIRSPSAQNTTQGFLNRKEPNRFINQDEAVSFGVQELAAGGVPMKLREQRKWHKCFLFGTDPSNHTECNTEICTNKGEALFFLLRSEVFVSTSLTASFLHEAFFFKMVPC